MSKGILLILLGSLLILGVSSDVPEPSQIENSKSESQLKHNDDLFISDLLAKEPIAKQKREGDQGDIKRNDVKKKKQQNRKSAKKPKKGVKTQKRKVKGKNRMKNKLKRKNSTRERKQAKARSGRKALKEKTKGENKSSKVKKSGKKGKSGRIQKKVRRKMKSKKELEGRLNKKRTIGDKKRQLKKNLRRNGRKNLKKGRKKDKAKEKRKKGQAKSGGKARMSKQATCTANEASDQCLSDVFEALNYEATAITNFLKQIARSRSFTRIMRSKNLKNDTFFESARFLKEVIGDPDVPSCGDYNENVTSAARQAQVNEVAKSAKSIYFNLMSCNGSVVTYCNIDSDDFDRWNATSEALIKDCEDGFTTFQEENKRCSTLPTAGETCACFDAQTNSVLPELKRLKCTDFTSTLQKDLRELLDSCVQKFGGCRGLQKDTVRINSACASGKVLSKSKVDESIVKFNQRN